MRAALSCCHPRMSPLVLQVLTVSGLGMGLGQAFSLQWL